MKELVDRAFKALLKEFEPELEAFTKQYAPRAPQRLCRECFDKDRVNNGRRAYYYRFDDDGSCAQCGKDVTADESTGVEG